MSAAPGMRAFALDQMNHLLTRLALRIRRAAKAPGVMTMGLRPTKAMKT